MNPKNIVKTALFCLVSILCSTNLHAQEDEGMISIMKSKASSVYSSITDVVDIHGFISQGYLHSNRNNLIPDADNGTFDFREIGLNVSKQFTDKLRMGVQFLSRDYGVTDNNRINIDWAYADYRFYDWLGLRVGKMKSPLGLYMETRDIDSLRTSILLPINNLYNENYREVMGYVVGAGVYGNIFTDNWGTFKYAAQYGVNDFDTSDGGTAQLARGITLGSLQDIKSDYVYMLHAEWLTPIEGLRLGISHGQYQYYHDFLLDPLWAPFYPVAAGDVFRMTFDNMRSYVGSAEYTIGNLVLFGEIMRLQVDYEAPGWVGETVTYNYYAGASYRVNDWLEVGSYYSEKIDPNDRDGVVASSMFYPTHYVETKDFAFSLRFDINDYWLFKTEYHHIDGSADMSFPYNPNGTHGSSNMLLGKITFSF